MGSDLMRYTRFYARRSEAATIAQRLVVQDLTTGRSRYYHYTLMHEGRAVCRDRRSSRCQQVTPRNRRAGHCVCLAESMNYWTRSSKLRRQLLDTICTQQPAGSRKQEAGSCLWVHCAVRTIPCHDATLMKASLPLDGCAWLDWPLSDSICTDRTTASWPTPWCLAVTTLSLSYRTFRNMHRVLNIDVLWN
jgi:hypothetical protein